MPGDTIIDTNSDRAKGWFLNILLIALLGIEIFLLVYDIPILDLGFSFRPASDPNAVPIARLMDKKNSVRVQQYNDLLWNDTREQQVLNRSESVLTQERSTADIAFLDGTGLVLGENSLIQLERQTQADPNLGHQITVRLLRGTIHTTSRKKHPSYSEIHIQMGDTIARVSPDSELLVTLTPESSHNGRILVQKGEVTVQTSSGQSHSIKKGEEAIVTQDSNAKSVISSKQIVILLQHPIQGQVLQEDPIEPQGESKFRSKTKFSWRVDGTKTGGSPLLLEVSRDPEFKTQTQSVRIGATEPPLEYIEATVDLPNVTEPTLWHWRVRAPGSQSIASGTETFWIQPRTKPILRFPMHQAHVVENLSIDLAWSEFPQANGYEIQISGKPQLDSKEPFLRIEKLTVGNYRWRVRAKLIDANLKTGFSPWSEGRDFVVDSMLPPPPHQFLPPEVQYPHESDKSH